MATQRRYAESTRTGAWYIVNVPYQYMHGKVMAQCTDKELQPVERIPGHPAMCLLTPDKIKLKAFID